MTESKSDKPIVVACAGDSITYGYGLDNPEAESYPTQLQKLLGEESYKVLNLGLNGATLAWEPRGVVPDAKDDLYSETEQYEQLLKSKPDVVVVILGTNDGFWKRKAEVFRKVYEELIEVLEKLEPKPKIVLGVPPPLAMFMGKEQHKFINELLPVLIPEIAAAHGFPVVNTWAELNPVKAEVMSDFCHPNAKGCAKIAELVHKALLNLKLK